MGTVNLELEPKFMFLAVDVAVRVSKLGLRASPLQSCDRPAPL